MTLLDLQNDPSQFRDALMIPTDNGAESFANRIEDFQRTDFAALDDGWKRAVLGKKHPAKYSRAWIERGRGASKSGDTAVMVTWALFAARRQIAGYAAAADLDQAAILRNTIARLLSVNPWLSKVLDVTNFRVTNHHTGSTLDILSSDAPTAYGLQPNGFVCIDEITQHAKRDLFDSLFSSAAKYATCFLLVTTNAGTMGDTDEEWQWKLRESIRENPKWYFSHLDYPASWIDEATLADQKALLPPRVFSKYWENTWCPSGLCEWVDRELIDFAFSNPYPPLTRPEPGWEYVGGLDLGVSRDASALCILGIRRDRQQHGMVKLAYSKVWRPTKTQKVNLQEVEEHLIECDARWDVSSLYTDPWNATGIVQRLSATGVGVTPRNLSERKPTRKIRISECPQTSPTLQRMAGILIQAFNDRRVQLYDDANLRRDLLSMKMEQKGAFYRLVAPRTSLGHADLGTAFSLAMLAASDLSGTPPRRTLRSMHADFQSGTDRAWAAFKSKKRWLEEEDSRLIREGCRDATNFQIISQHPM